MLVRGFWAEGPPAAKQRAGIWLPIGSGGRQVNVNPRPPHFSPGNLLECLNKERELGRREGRFNARLWAGRRSRAEVS